MITSILSHFLLISLHGQADTPYIDDPAMGFSTVTQLANIIKNAMNPTCASNVISLLCHSFFKECVRVQDESSRGELWLPSLLCRGACNKHWEIWTQCLIDLELDPVAKSSFDAQMLSLVRHTSFGVQKLSKLVSTSFGVRFRAQVNTISYGASLLFDTGEFL
jgi:hypothetical protein